MEEMFSLEIIEIEELEGKIAPGGLMGKSITVKPNTIVWETL